MCGTVSNRNERPVNLILHEELTVTDFTIFTVRNSSCRKVMFSQASVILSMGGMCARGVCMVGSMHDGGHAWHGGMCGREGHA